MHQKKAQSCAFFCFKLRLLKVQTVRVLFVRLWWNNAVAIEQFGVKFRHGGLDVGGKENCAYSKRQRTQQIPSEKGQPQTEKFCFVAFHQFNAFGNCLRAGKVEIHHYVKCHTVGKTFDNRQPAHYCHNCTARQCQYWGNDCLRHVHSYPNKTNGGNYLWHNYHQRPQKHEQQKRQSREKGFSVPVKAVAQHFKVGVLVSLRTKEKF